MVIQSPARPAVRGGVRPRRDLNSQNSHRARRPLPPSSVPGQCFDAACQAAQDRAFVAAVLAPLATIVAAGVWFYTRQPPEGALVDRDSGAVLECVDGAAGGTAALLDARGDPVCRAAGYTPTPVAEGDTGADDVVVRVPVGAVGARAPRSYVFTKRSRAPSRIVAVAMGRPLGVVFAESGDRVIVDELEAGGEAARRAAAAALDPVRLGDTVLAPGDVLRGVTATTFVFRGPAALAGLAAPSREIVLFGADGEKWPAVKAALRRGDRSDGDVVVVVERAGEAGLAGAATAPPDDGGRGEVDR